MTVYSETIIATGAPTVATNHPNDLYGESWTNPENVLSLSTSDYAYNQLGFDNTGTFVGNGGSVSLLFKDFGFNIPTNARIKSISAKLLIAGEFLTREEDSVGFLPEEYATSFRMTNATNKRSRIYFYGFSLLVPTPEIREFIIHNPFESYSFDEGTQEWNGYSDTWNPSDVNDPDFSFLYKAMSLNDIPGNVPYAKVYNISVDVAYEMPPNGVVIGGISFNTKNERIITTGGVSIGSSAIIDQDKIYFPIGGVKNSGFVRPYGVINEPPNGLPRGGLSGKGGAKVSSGKNFSYQSSGQVILDGTSPISFVEIDLVGDGGIQVSQFVSPVQYKFRFIKTTNFSWNRKAIISKEVKFSWNVGQLNTYWYRVIGKGVVSDCLPQDPCCQKFILNIHARSLSELCEKLSKRRFKFPIESVQRFSRPAERAVIAADEANGISHNCNVLQEVQVCNIPQCADFCVDQDLIVDIGFNIKIQVDAFKTYVANGSAYLLGDSDVVFHPNIPNVSFTSTGGLTINGNVIAKNNSFIPSGGIKLSGKSRVGANRWSFIGGVWPNTTGLMPPTNVSMVANVNEQPWLLPDRILTNDGLYSSSDISYAKTTQQLIVKGFNFSIPYWAEILSIVVNINRLATQVGVRDKELYLINGDNIISDNLANTVSDWPLLGTVRDYGINGWRNSNFDGYLGVFNPSELSGSQFGVMLKVNSRTALPATIARIDYINVEITYQDPFGSIIKLTSDSGLKAKGPTYHTVASGKILLGSNYAIKSTHIYNVKLQRAGVRLGGHGAFYDEYKTSGFAIINGSAKITPFNEISNASVVIGGLAEVKPYLDNMIGGIYVNGSAKISGDIRYVANGSLSISGAAFTPEKKMSYLSTGNIFIDGSVKIRKESWSWNQSSGINILGSADQVAGSVSVPLEIVGLNMYVIQTTASFVDDIDLKDALGVTQSINKCGCFSLPLIIDLSHNFSKNNVFAKFLIRNNLTIARTLKMRYNEPNDSWQLNLHFKGLAPNANSYETWDLICELQCTDLVGSIGIGRSIWKLSIQIFRKNLTTREIFDTRIIVGILPEAICGSIVNQLDFNVTYDTQNNYCVVDPNANIYQNSIFDNIGMFKNPAWIDNPNLVLKISQSSTIKPQTRINLTDSVLV